MCGYTEYYSNYENKYMEKNIHSSNNHATISGDQTQNQSHVGWPVDLTLLYILWEPGKHDFSNGNISSNSILGDDSTARWTRMDVMLRKSAHAKEKIQNYAQNFMASYTK